jgi:hypothetical protein
VVQGGDVEPRRRRQRIPAQHLVVHAAGVDDVAHVAQRHRLVEQRVEVVAVNRQRGVVPQQRLLVQTVLVQR